jgi:hypothetical protein
MNSEKITDPMFPVVSSNKNQRLNDPSYVQYSFLRFSNEIATPLNLSISKLAPTKFPYLQLEKRKILETLYW